MESIACGRNRLAAHSRLAALFVLVGGSLIWSNVSFAQDEVRSFLHISDIHLDPFTPFAGRTLSPYGQDTNYALLNASLDAIARVGKDVGFAIVTGDLLAHDFEAKREAALSATATSAARTATAVSTSNFVAEALATAMPGKPIILALGNNDSDCGDYQINPGGPYLAGTRETVRRLAGADLVAADFDQTYQAGGYYAMRHPTVADVEILVLNDVLWARDYRDTCGANGLAAAEKMLDWLKQRLAALRSQNRKAWLVHHIPIGIDGFATLGSKETGCRKKPVLFMSEPFNTHYLALLREHATNIRANLVGHVHFDGYRLILDEKSQVLGVEKLAPAISPIFGQNPGFLRFEYDPKTGEPTDFTTIYLTNLQHAADPASADWQREYRFTEAYGQRRFDAAAVNAIWGAIAEKGPVREIYGSYYDVSSPKFTPTLPDAFYCAIGEAGLSSFTSCMCDE